MKGLFKMSDIEILSEILNEIKAINNKVDNLERDVKEIKQDNKTIHAKLDTLENKVDTLEQDVKRNTIVTESTVNQCIKVLGDGWKFNAERFDRLDIDNVRMKTDQAFMMSKLVNEKVDKLSEKIEKAG